MFSTFPQAFFLSTEDRICEAAHTILAQLTFVLTLRLVEFIVDAMVKLLALLVVAVGLLLCQVICTVPHVGVHSMFAVRLQNKPIMNVVTTCTSNQELAFIVVMAFVVMVVGLIMTAMALVVMVVTAIVMVVASVMMMVALVVMVAFVVVALVVMPVVTCSDKVVLFEYVGCNGAELCAAAEASFALLLHAIVAFLVTVRTLQKAIILSTQDRVPKTLYTIMAQLRKALGRMNFFFNAIIKLAALCIPTTGFRLFESCICAVPYDFLHTVLAVVLQDLSIMEIVTS